MKYLLAFALAAGAAAPALAADLAPLPNEAVSTVLGRMVVELPPGPVNPAARKTHRTLEHWSGGVMLPAYVIATSDGPRECFQQWIDASCRPYRKGAEQRERAWVVKRGGQWLTCPRDNSAQGCVRYLSFPITETQD